jgi:3-oxoacyl-[acyl-carrier-protein] synthase II
MSLIDPLFLLKSLPNAGLCGAAIEHGMQGPNLNIMNGSTSGLLAVAAAADSILRGDTPVALAGGYDSLVQLETVLAHLIDRRLRIGNASGYLPSEGAVFFVLEEKTHAQERGAHIFAEVAGSAVTHSGPHDIPEQGAAAALERAARASGGTEQQTQQASWTAPDAVFGDGLNLSGHDVLETEVLKRVASGQRDIPLLSNVSRIGFAGAATGLFSLLHAALSIDGQLPVTDDGAAGKPPEKLLVWTSDRGRDHVAVTLRRPYAPATEAPACEP